MSMLLIMRDTAALLELEKELQVVREKQLRSVSEGRRMDDAELREAEDAVIDAIKAKYFCHAGRLAFLPAEQADAVSDEEDYARRMGKDAEPSIVDAHHLILSVPCVGESDYGEPQPQVPPAERH